VVRFRIDPTDPAGDGSPLVGFARRALDVEIGGRFFDPGVSDWRTTGVRKGDTVRILDVGPDGTQRRRADYPIILVRQEGVYVTPDTPPFGVPFFCARIEVAPVSRAVPYARERVVGVKLRGIGLTREEHVMGVTRINKKKSVKEQVSAEEWAKRIDLAAAYRLVHLYGMDEMIANHISTRVPGEDNAFLINPYGLLYEQMHASCFIKLDLDGKILFNPTEYDINKAGFIIHSAIHRARHEWTASSIPIRSPGWRCRR